MKFEGNFFSPRLPLVAPLKMHFYSETGLRKLRKVCLFSDALHSDGLNLCFALKGTTLGYTPLNMEWNSSVFYITLSYGYECRVSPVTHTFTAQVEPTPIVPVFIFFHVPHFVGNCFSPGPVSFFFLHSFLSSECNFESLW